MNKRIQKKYKLKKSIRKFLYKSLISVIIFLLGSIILKKYPNTKQSLNETIFEHNIKFQKISSVYDKYFGNILSLGKKKNETTPVFQEKITYQKIEAFEKGAKLKVPEHYMVPILESGVVIYLGKKEKYGNTIIVEQVDGVDTLYANVNSNRIKLYDYVEKGELLGEVQNNKLYLVFQKNGEYLDYQKYI